MATKNIREVTVDGQPFDVETDDKGVTFFKHTSSLPFLSICWQDVYSSAWNFTRMRAEYEKKTAVAGRVSGESE